MNALEAKHPGEKEYLQAVREVLLSVEDIYNRHPEFERNRIIERMVEPDRIVTFHRPVQRRNPFPRICKPFDSEIPRLRTDIQKRPHNPSHGWCQRR